MSGWLDGWTDQPIYRQTDKQAEPSWWDLWIDGWMEGGRDKLMDHLFCGHISSSYTQHNLKYKFWSMADSSNKKKKRLYVEFGIANELIIHFHHRHLHIFYVCPFIHQSIQMSVGLKTLTLAVTSNLFEVSCTVFISDMHMPCVKHLQMTTLFTLWPWPSFHSGTQWP